MVARRQNQCSKCAKRNARIAELEASLAEAESKLAAANENSGNSSKPPSSEIVNPPKKQNKPGRPKKRNKRTQPGHPRHQRKAFREDGINEHWAWRFDCCPCCGVGLQDADKPARILQQIELPVVPVQSEQHRAMIQHCTDCGKTHRVQLPEELRKAGLVGPRLTALVGWLNWHAGL